MICHTKTRFDLFVGSLSFPMNYFIILLALVAGRLRCFALGGGSPLLGWSAGWCGLLEGPVRGLSHAVRHR